MKTHYREVVNYRNFVQHVPGLSDKCPWASIFGGLMLAPNRSPGLLFGSMGLYLAVIL